MAAAGLAAGLDRRARHIPIGTKDAAVPGLGFEDRATSLAVIEELARIGRHRFPFPMAARGTSDRGLQERLRHKP